MNAEPGAPSLISLPWRTGRKVGRTIYARMGPEASDDDPLIGVMDTPELAAEAAAAHSWALTYRLALRRADAAAVADDDLDDDTVAPEASGGDSRPASMLQPVTFSGDGEDEARRVAMRPVDEAEDEW